MHWVGRLLKRADFRARPHYRPRGKILVGRSEFDAWMAAYRECGRSDVGKIVDAVLRDLKGS